MYRLRLASAAVGLTKLAASSPAAPHVLGQVSPSMHAPTHGAGGTVSERDAELLQR